MVAVGGVDTGLLDRARRHEIELNHLTFWRSTFQHDLPTGNSDPSTREVFTTLVVRLVSVGCLGLD